MQVVKTSAAFSAAKVADLLLQVQRISKDIIALSVQRLFLVQVADVLTEAQQRQLDALLAEDNHGEVDVAYGAQAFYVLPRSGTISPWSSKATEIAKQCGLPLTLLEKGRIYYLQTATKALDSFTAEQRLALENIMADPMLETVHASQALLLQSYQEEPPPGKLCTVAFATEGLQALQRVNEQWGLALSSAECHYLLQHFADLQRDPTDVELMMFAQANSEHCRHKIFNASWQTGEGELSASLFAAIKSTYQTTSSHVLSAYADNAAVISGHTAVQRFYPCAYSHCYAYHEEAQPILMKVETHNHPTAISPFPGAATGNGGEIRDEGATGRGGKPKAGLTGFSVSNLNLTNFPRPWEQQSDKPQYIAAAVEIMLQAPIGGARYNNEFGRPCLSGYFRCYEQVQNTELSFGYHKPIMIAGGLGHVKAEHVQKLPLRTGDKIIVLGGPAFLIGLGGGAASSMASGSSDAKLDYASVQRDNAEIERRCQEVIDRCWQLGSRNPIRSIHDVGAGGLSNAIPEIVHDSNCGASIDLRAIPCADPSLSPLQIWCNESQERYVLAIAASDVVHFQVLAERERCPFAVVGEVTAEPWLLVQDSVTGRKAVDIPMSLLFACQANKPRVATACKQHLSEFVCSLPLAQLIERVISHPTVASKQFLITIGDRSIGGLVARDQMVGPWQVPVADVAVTLAGFQDNRGEAMAVAERAPVALLDAAASVRLCLGEVITNLCAADVRCREKIKLSANWMAACGESGEDYRLKTAVEALTRLAKQLSLTIPVGKDSLSMRTQWQQAGQKKKVVSPLSLILSAFTTVEDSQLTWTPELKKNKPSSLLLIDLGLGKNRLGGSIAAEVCNQLGATPPDLDDAQLLTAFMDFLSVLRARDYVLAYHDRSDGGLLTTLLEMAFSARTGLTVQIAAERDLISSLFAEELGAVIQIAAANQDAVMALAEQFALQAHIRECALLNDSNTLVIQHGQNIVWQQARAQCQQVWSRVSYEMQKIRDNEACATAEYSGLAHDNDPGLNAHITDSRLAAASSNLAAMTAPRAAILREQGVNGQVEMAAAFHEAGFQVDDVTMSDLQRGEKLLSDYQLLAVCGGFSYGDVLGAGRGWAESILQNYHLAEMFSQYFQSTDTLTFGVCNGCQMLAHLRALIPGAAHWPNFVNNLSEQFEARFSLVKITSSPSLLLSDLVGSVLPVAVAHGEGRVNWSQHPPDQSLLQKTLALQFVDNHHQPSEQYPYNPNGSVNGSAGFTSLDGRVTIMMPHPERVFLQNQMSWTDERTQRYSPWMRLFQQARHCFL